MNLAERMREVISLAPTSWAIEFEGDQYSWGELGTLADVIARELSGRGVTSGDVVGWVASNTPATVAAQMSLLLHDYCAAILNPHLGQAVQCGEITNQRFPAIVADPGFWRDPAIIAAAREAGSIGLQVEWNRANALVSVVPGLERLGAGAHRVPMPDIVIERLSSGTTGAPKRSPQTRSAIANALMLGERKEKGDDGRLRLKTSPSIVFRSLAHAGSFATMLALYSARPISLHEKFTVDAVVDAIRRHRPKVISLVPTMIKMIWDAQVPAEHLASIVAIRSGTAPLDPKLQGDFEEKYGAPILIDYGATEFGGVAAWTMADHKAFAKQKRGSVGRPVKGAVLRIVDLDSGEEVPAGAMGLLEVRSVSADEWTRTTDLASLDADGFLFIHGRADDAIIRGGFKVLPDEVVKVLRAHPDVTDAAVVGIPDERLGQVPVAVVEVRKDHAALTEDDLRAFARANLTPYQMPVAFKFVDQLPRSVSMKIVRPEVLRIAAG
jgi:acyl-CoA synthetase (AMP-forming)/AMP-acid ligase II